MPHMSHVYWGHGTLTDASHEPCVMGSWDFDRCNIRPSAIIALSFSCGINELRVAQKLHIILPLSANRLRTQHY